jgi:hypothetical protein
VPHFLPPMIAKFGSRPSRRPGSSFHRRFFFRRESPPQLRRLLLGGLQTARPLLLRARPKHAPYLGHLISTGNSFPSRYAESG